MRPLVLQDNRQHAECHTADAEDLLQVPLGKLLPGPQINLMAPPAPLAPA